MHSLTPTTYTYSSSTGSQSQSAVAVVKVTVKDLNDNAPRFNNMEHGVIPAVVYENKDNNTLIVQVTAVDPDEGDNSRVSYSITGGGCRCTLRRRLVAWTDCVDWLRGLIAWADCVN